MPIVCARIYLCVYTHDTNWDHLIYRDSHQGELVLYKTAIALLRLLQARLLTLGEEELLRLLLSSLAPVLPDHQKVQALSVSLSVSVSVSVSLLQIVLPCRYGLIRY